jgi:pyruvate dehydrogenase E1 component beta subunit
MFGGNYSPSMVIRVAVGRQWGNGPQHTQGLYSLFGGVPGLRVVIPSSPNMAYSLLKAAQRHNGPVIFLEPRWLYGLTGNIKRETVNIGEARTVRSGLDLTIVAYGDGVFSAVKAAEMLERHGISVEIIDLVSINPIDYEHIKRSLRMTKRLLTVDTAPAQFSVGREIIGAITADFFEDLDLKYASVATPNYPCPTAPSLVSNYYPTRISIANAALVMLNRPQLEEKLSFEELHLSPKTEISYD